MSTITRELAPFVMPKRPHAGVVLEVFPRPDGRFEVTTITPGSSTKQGGILTAPELFQLGRDLARLAAEHMGSMWRDHQPKEPA